MSDKHDKKHGSTLGNVFKKAAKYTLVGTFSFFVLGGLDFIFFHELEVGAAFAKAIQPVGEALFMNDIPILGASVADGIGNVTDMIHGVVGEPISADSVFTEAFTEGGPNAW